MRAKWLVGGAFVWTLALGCSSGGMNGGSIHNCTPCDITVNGEHKDLACGATACIGGTEFTCVVGGGIKEGGACGPAPADAMVESADAAVPADPCQTGNLDCDHDSAHTCEVDPQTDTHNCGTCGHDCLGGGCGNGRCQPMSLVPVSHEDGAPEAMLVSGDRLYWTAYSAVLTISKQGGVARKIAPIGDQVLSHLAVDDSNVYWTEPQAGRVMRAPLSGMDAGTPVVTGQKNPSSIAVDASHLYWTNDAAEGAGGLFQAALEGGTAAPLSPPQDATGMLLWHGSLIWLNDEGDLFALDISAMQPKPRKISHGSGIGGRLAIGGDHVYWTQDFDAGENDTLLTAPIAGGPAQVLLQQHPVRSVAADGQYLYYAEYHDLMRVKLKGGKPEAVASGLDCPGDIAMDDQAVYWINIVDSNCEPRQSFVQKLAK